MKRLSVTMLIVLLNTIMTLSQDWVYNIAGDTQYNCEVVNELNRDYGDQPYVQSGGAAFTVEEFHAMTVPDCQAQAEASALASEEAITVMVHDIVNLRECASTSCIRVGATRSGDVLEVVGEDGDWLEVKYENTTVFIAGWLTTRMVDPPAGLLADFQFSSLSPVGDAHVLMTGSTTRTGTHWLRVAHDDGTWSMIELQAIFWGADDDNVDFNWYQYPVFFGWGEHDWEYLPSLLPDSSFYIYLRSDKQIYELPISDSVYSSSFELGSDLSSRPPSIRRGSPVRVLVADSGQSEEVMNWAESVTEPRVTLPPGKLLPPTLIGGGGYVVVSIDVPQVDDAPILAYALRYHEQESGSNPMYAFSNATEPFVIENLTDGKTYRVSVAAVNRGGMGPWSGSTSVTLGG
ncbi:MAG: fibronectin type III domain-containing protein [Chloroflexi bacterium]|nr:fibronectin type III domain-containing protein [Chloroflexota bacterium]